MKCLGAEEPDIRFTRPFSPVHGPVLVRISVAARSWSCPVHASQIGEPASRMHRVESTMSSSDPPVLVCQMAVQFRLLKSRLTVPFAAAELPAAYGPITIGPGQ